MTPPRITVTIFRDEKPLLKSCNLCFSKIDDTLACEIRVAKPFHVMSFHTGCYETMFIGMLQLAEDLSKAELN